MTLSWVDITIAGVVMLSMITGLFRGFVKEVIALCVWVFAFWFAFHYGSMLDPWVAPHVKDNTVRIIIEFIIILLLSLIFGGIINALIGLIMRRSGLSGTDRLLGMGFGFARGVFIVAVIILGIHMTGMDVKEFSKESQLYSKLDPLVDWLKGYVPDFIQKVKLFDKNEHLTTKKDLEP
jgi:membrane protein required for colicin V production